MLANYVMLIKFKQTQTDSYYSSKNLLFIELYMWHRGPAYFFYEINGLPKLLMSEFQGRLVFTLVYCQAAGGSGIHHQPTNVQYP
jgi:hypothetical protein